MADRLAGIADELYGVPPAGFVAERDARVRDLAGDAALAAQVKSLRKPAPAAGVVNLIVRARRDDLEQFLALGDAVRTAQESFDREAITRLTAQRRDLVTALARDGAQLARDAGQQVPAGVVDAVAATLDAGLADAEAADAIRSGRLLRGLQAIGFEPVDLAEAVALPEAGSRAARKREPERPRPRAIDDGDAELRRARDRADAVVARAEQEATTAARELSRLESRVRAARKALAAAERDAATLERRREDADRALGSARAALDVAKARRADLGG